MSDFLRVSSYQEADKKYRGIIIGSDERAILWTKQSFKLPETAHRHARAEFLGALYDCQHVWGKWSDEHSEDTAWGGSEYVSTCDCESCGLRRYNIADKPQDF
jgi:hypothetical protein